MYDEAKRKPRGNEVEDPRPVSYPSGAGLGWLVDCCRRVLSCRLQPLSRGILSPYIAIHAGHHI